MWRLGEHLAERLLQRGQSYSFGTSCAPGNLLELSILPPPHAAGTQHAAPERGQVCPARPLPRRVLARPSHARVQPDFRTPSGGGPPDPLRRSEALLRTKGGRRAAKPPSASAVPAPARPARRALPTPRRGERPAAPPTPPQGSPPPASRRSLGSHPAPARIHPSSPSPWLPGPAEMPGSLPHT